MDALQSQYDEKVTSSEELLKLKESEVANLSHEINLLQEKISFYAVRYKKSNEVICFLYLFLF